jgi:PAS domain S-box-containing protein
MLGLATLLPILGLAWWQSHEVELRSAQDWDRLLVARALDTAEDVESLLQLRLDEIQLLGVRAEAMPDWSNTSKLRGLFDERFGASGFSVLLLGDPWGTSLVSSPEFTSEGRPYAGVNYRDRAYFKRMRTASTPVVGDAAIGRLTGKANVSLAAPVRAADGSLRGWVLGTILLDQLRDRVIAGRHHDDSRVVVVDAAGSVIVDSNRAPTAMTRFRGVAQQGLGGPATLLSLREEDGGELVRRASAPVHIGGVSWRVYVSAPLTQVAARAKEIRRSTAWGTGGALLAGLALVYLVAALATRDMRALAALAAQLGRGDAAAPVQRMSRLTPRETVEVWHAMQDAMRALDERWRERGLLIANLQRANEHARSLATGLRDATDGFVVLDRDLRIEYVNPAWQRMRERTLDEVVGQRALELDVGEGANAEQLEAAVDALTRRQPWAGAIEFRRRRGGEVGEADLSISPVFNDEGDVERYVALVRDVTGKRQAEQALQQSERLASLGMLAAGVAHEINNPMTFVLGNLEHLSELTQSGALRAAAELDLESCLSDSLHGARRVVEIVADLRALSQPRADNGDAVASGLQTIETCLRMAQSQLRHRTEVVRDFPEEDLWFRIGAQRLGQVLLNLVINAAQAMSPERSTTNRLTVSMRRLDERRGEVAVRDTGCGMNLEVAQRIFDPFFTTKGPGSGTGLGLSISHSIVASAHGEILVESEVGKGSCFRVLLPVARPSSAAERDAPAALHGLSVLVIDDEPGVLTAVRRMLASCRTATAGSVEQALEMIEREHFDVVLSDVMMAEATGVELVQTLRARAPQLARRVCLMSGGVIGVELDLAVRATGVPLLHKPLTRQVLHQALWEVHRASGA